MEKKYKKMDVNDLNEYAGSKDNILNLISEMNDSMFDLNTLNEFKSLLLTCKDIEKNANTIIDILKRAENALIEDN